mmetsp:Transcript_27603/g.82843  ORF Transcript_27603/g.82843 Transcript_27603/m.82843 type:complete len:323 (-) Transcript_27603:29-997(-)
MGAKPQLTASAIHPPAWVRVIAALLIASLFAVTLVEEERVEILAGGGRELGLRGIREPMCLPNGTCRERGDEPSPRTRYTAWTPKQRQNWFKYHDQLVENARAYKPSRTKRPLLLIGDSITESWAGTSYGGRSQRAEGTPAVLAEKFGGRFDPLVLAISGDQTQHVLWRLQEGEWPAAAEGAAVVLLIGTNNLGNGHLPGEAARGAVAVAEAILERLGPQGRLVVLELLPRDDGSKVLPWLCPPRCDGRGNAFQSFGPAVVKANREIRTALEARRDPRVVVVGCGDRLADAEGKTRGDLMPDKLHPNARGMALVADCVLEKL